MTQGVAITAHRGARLIAPENTMRAFRAAADLGVDYIELDVHTSRDGELVVMHDDSVDRTTDGSGLIADLGWDTIRTLDAGQGEAVPNLAEVLAELDESTVALQIELKDEVSVNGVAALLESRRAWQSRVVVSSFLTPVLARFSELMPAVRRGLIVHGWSPTAVDSAVEWGCQFLYSGWPGLDAGAAAATSARGIEPVVWLVNDAPAWRRAVAMGAAGVSTDDPALCLDLRTGRAGPGGTAQDAAAR